MMLDKPKRGRPRNDEDDDPTLIIGVRVPLSLWSQLRDAGKTNCRSIAAEALFRLMRDLKDHADT